MSPADEFLALLKQRLPGALLRHADLALMGPVYRCDRMFEAGADLSDACAAFEAGRVGADTLREHALDVAALSFAAYVATVNAQPVKEGATDGC